MYHVLCTKVEAQEQIELTVSPPVAYIKIKPASKARHTVTLQNTGSETVQVSTTIVDFKPASGTGLPVLSQATSFPYLDDESKNLSSLTLEPQQKAQLTLQFTVPQDAPEQEFPLTILFSVQETATNSVGTVARVQQTIGSNMIILVSAQNSLTQELTVTDFKIPKFFDSFSPLSFQPVVKNLKVSSSIASGSAILKNAFGKTVSEYKIYPDVILGQNERQLRFTTAEELVNPDQANPRSFTYNPLLLLGPYTLIIQFNSSTDVPYQAQFVYSFLAVPYAFLFLITFGICIGVAYYYRKSKAT